MELQNWRVKLIGQRLAEGAVIAYPTEGVWGLGCLPGIPEAVGRILELKRRDWQAGLILAAATIEQLEPCLAGITAAERARLEADWPGPVTYLVQDNGTVPEWIRGSHPTVALRVSAHPVIRAICTQVGGPIVSTSANPSGKPPARTMLRLRQYFPQGIDLVVPGEVGNSEGATEIRDLATGNILRPAVAAKSSPG